MIAATPDTNIVIELAPDLTPLGHAVVALMRFRRTLRGMTDAERRVLAPMLRDVVADVTVS